MAASRVESLAMKTFSETGLPQTQTGSPPARQRRASAPAPPPPPAPLPQGDLFSRSFSSEETISFSARDVDEPRDSLLAPRGSRDSLRSLLRDRPGSRLC